MLFLPRTYADEHESVCWVGWGTQSLLLSASVRVFQRPNLKSNPSRYSYRKALMGSMRDARIAGM
jgi:hypothetical protein